MLPPGTRVGDYEIEAELGAGGMATVYRARHALLDSHFALKVLDPRYRASAEARARFLDEARIQHKHLDHPNIVKVVNIVATAEHAALVMELIEGPSLEDVAAQLRGRPDEVRRLMLGVLGAVGHAHAAGIVHRDLKPANVLLFKKGERYFPKVTDFGIAKVSAAMSGPHKKSTQGDRRMGTLGYMSPEQIKRAKDVTAQSDIFSLGVMLYELATGALPFDGDNDYEVMDRVIHGRYQAPEERAPGIDPAIARVIRRALAVEPTSRFASCEDMAAALEGRPAAPAVVEDADAEWDRHDPTPVPPPALLRQARELAAASAASELSAAGAWPVLDETSIVPARAVLTPAIVRHGPDVRSPWSQTIDRAAMPAAAAVGSALLVGLLAGPLVGVMVAVAVALGVDAQGRRARFRTGSTIQLRIDARAEHRARLAAVMRDLGFDPADEDEGSLHPIAALPGGNEARTFQVAVPNVAALQTLYERCHRDLRGEHQPPASVGELEAPESFAAYLGDLLWSYRIDQGAAHCLVRVVQWQRAR